MVAGAIGTVNPFTRATIKQSTGYTTNSDGSRTPTYSTRTAMIQVQALSSDDLKQIDGLNIQGSKNTVFLNGNWGGIIRVGREGGDLLEFNGQTWLAVTANNWPDWTQLIVVLQNGS